NLLAINLVPPTGGTFQPGKADKLVFIGAWNVAANASGLNVTNSTGPPGTVSTVTDNATGYSAAIVTSPRATGTWSVSAAGATQPDAKYLLVDMKLYAQFLVEQRQYSAGEPILLTVDLRDEGRPVLGADVRFDLERPTLGLGDFLSTIQESCTFAPPTAPAPPPLDSIRARLKLGAAAGAHVATPAGSGDPLPGRYRLAADHVQRCGEDVLGRAHDTGIRMRDDGMPPDVEKDDGVYATAYTPPEEGSYNLRFLVSGKTTDGAPFERTYRLSDFARITPSAEATQQIVQNGGIVNGRQVTHILLLFRDSSGNYLGPKLGEFLKVRVTGAHVIDSLSDAGNGYYRITIDHTPGGPEPTVSVSMPGSTYEQRVDLSPGGGRLFALSLHAGVSIPHGTLNSTHDAGFGITADAEYWWRPRLAAVALLGYHRFNGQGANADLDVVHASAALEARVTTGQPSVLVNAGAGVYNLSPGPTDLGVHGGAGLEYDLSPTISLGLAGRVHTVFTTGSNTTFSSLQAGGRIRF
ncbi:MAG: choice-of-anchor X domain-containing protein, partial [Gemmatimonadales bacterium]